MNDLKLPIKTVKLPRWKVLLFHQAFAQLHVNPWRLTYEYSILQQLTLINK